MLVIHCAIEPKLAFTPFSGVIVDVRASTACAVAFIRNATLSGYGLDIEAFPTLGLRLVIRAFTTEAPAHKR